jgi:hypothetical protein
MRCEHLDSRTFDLGIGSFFAFANVDIIEGSLGLRKP